MNKDQLKEALKILKKNGVTVTKVADKMALTQTYISDITGGRKIITNNFISSFKKEYESLIPAELFEEEIQATKTAGEVIEELIMLKAWVTVVEAQLIAWAPLLKQNPEQLTERLQKAKALEVDRLFSELSRTKK